MESPRFVVLADDLTSAAEAAGHLADTGRAASVLLEAAAGGAAWPSVSYDNSFTETDSQQSGTGTSSGDILLKVARRYGADSDAGPWSCTATFTGSMASKTPMAALVVFRAEDTADPPAPVMTS